MLLHQRDDVLRFHHFRVLAAAERPALPIFPYFVAAAHPSMLTFIPFLSYAHGRYVLIGRSPYRA